MPVNGQYTNHEKVKARRELTMNGKIHKFAMEIYSDPNEAIAFLRQYLNSSPEQRAEARQAIKKIIAMKRKGKEVNLFRINPMTHQMEMVEKGDENGLADTSTGSSGSPSG